MQHGEYICGMKTLFVGVAGGTGSGKSTFTQNLKHEFGDAITVIFYDNYYKDQSGVPVEERDKINYDCPDALDTDLLIEHIHTLKEGQSVQCPIYDFATHTRKAETLEIKPNRIIVIEGILAFHEKELRDTFDLKIYVDSDADERILRRIMRDIQDRGRQIGDIALQYITTVKPMHNLYVEPTKAYADIIIRGGLNPTALDVIQSKLKFYLDSQE